MAKSLYEKTLDQLSKAHKEGQVRTVKFDIHSGKYITPQCPVDR